MYEALCCHHHQALVGSCRRRLEIDAGATWREWWWGLGRVGVRDGGWGWGEGHIAISITDRRASPTAEHHRPLFFTWPLAWTSAWHLSSDRCRSELKHPQLPPGSAARDCIPTHRGHHHDTPSFHAAAGLKRGCAAKEKGGGGG